MCNGDEGGVVNVLIADEPPTDVLADEAQALLDDLIQKLMRASTDRERFYLCVAVSGAEQVAYALLTSESDDGYRYRTPVEVSQDYFGRRVSAL